MAKQKLLIEYDFDFILIGISFHDQDYKLCWWLNKIPGLDLKREEDLLVPTKSKGQSSAHSLFFGENEENFTSFFLLSNKGNEGILIPEHKNVDYFLMIRGPVAKKDLEELIGQIKSFDRVQAVFNIEVSELKSKHNLVF